MHSNTKKVAFAAILSALGTLFLLLGSVFPALDMTGCAVASLAVMIACIELGMGYGVGTYATTAVLGFLVGSGQQLPLFYLFLFGAYPIVKLLCEKLPKVWSWVLKFVFCNAMFCVVLFLFDWLFGFFSTVEFGAWYWVALIVAGNGIFLLYDIALSQLVRFYFARFHRYFPKL